MAIAPKYELPGFVNGHPGTYEVRPVGGRAWIGMFALGTIAPGGVSSVFSMPAAQKVCVVARGQAFLGRLEITGISSTTIHGKCWDAPQGRMAEFSVDLLTGKHPGGVDRAE